MTAILRSYASLVFSANPIAGALVLAASLAQPAVGLAGLLALVAGNLTARALGYRADLIASGHYGYAAILVGLALAFGREPSVALVGFVALGGVAATVATAVVGDALFRGLGLPALALPFVIVATVLAPALAHLPAEAAWTLDGALGLPRPIVPLDGALRALGAIVFVPTPIAGIAMLIAIAIGSRIAAAVAIAGVAVGIAATHALAVADPLLALAMTYNAALAALVIGAAAFVPGRAALLAGLIAAALAAWTTVGLAAVLAPLHLGVLAWPFTLVALAGVRALHLRSPDRAPLPAPLPGASPEQNLAYVAGRSRLGVVGPPPLALPFFGTWAVTQGVDGKHTHQGPWIGALDFEVLDADGFPFRGDGLHLEDYRCFGLPVLAPASGVVVAVHDGVPDNAPGEVDTARPWGNAIVIAFGPELHVVLAHLKLGSIRVTVGQPVAVGQPIAACGASGRSPRPHLHLQVQRRAELGDAALPFRLAHYVLEGEARRYVAVGVPREGERVAKPTPNPVVAAFTALPVGGELALELERGDARGGTRLRLRSEIDLHGDRFLRDLDRGDRLYFATHDGHLVFTTYAGASRAPLAALFAAIPRLPSATGPIAIVDSPPAQGLLGAHAAALRDVARVVGDPVEARADIELADGEGGEVTITTKLRLGLRGRTRPRFASKVAIDRAGLRTLELYDRHGSPLLRATRPETP